jgi:hypothetical protein
LIKFGFTFKSLPKKKTTFEFLNKNIMKQFLYILLFAAVGIFAMIEQSKSNPNQYLMIAAMAIFMYGLFQLMKKIPSKKDEDNDTEI